MATFTHQSDRIVGLLKFTSATPQIAVVQIACELMDQVSDPKNVDRLEVVSCGTAQWGILFSYRYDGTRETYKKIVHSITHNVRRPGHSVNWSITNDVAVIKRN